MPPRKRKNSTADAPSKAKKAKGAASTPSIKASRKASEKSKAATDTTPARPDESGEDQGDNDEKAKGNTVWNDERSFELLRTISEHPDISRVIYPPEGGNASTQQGGGKSKTEFYFKLCYFMFPNDISVLDTLKTASAQKPWGMKIKNRLKSMEKTVREHVQEMGETGAGISKEDEIDMSLDNELTNKWAIIKLTCPWFFEMRELMGERPNKITAGVGNSQDEIDTKVLEEASAGATASEEVEHEASSPRSDEPSSFATAVQAQVTANTNSDAADPQIPRAVPEVKKTAPRATVSKVTTTTKKKKPEGFVELATAEETTRQRHIELALLREQNRADRIALEREKEGRRKEKSNRKMDLLQRFHDQEHQLKLAQLEASRKAAAPSLPLPQMMPAHYSFAASTSTDQMPLQAIYASGLPTNVPGPSLLPPMPANGMMMATQGPMSMLPRELSAPASEISEAREASVISEIASSDVASTYSMSEHDFSKEVEDLTQNHFF
ncbi:hypothetical protein EIP86_002831 [Pleurotus ostreatoroseus]|nr:hypothetical protein EIP86_002831 [Pleurotus ostreatoroseus]